MDVVLAEEKDQSSFAAGIFLIDKPVGPTSFSMVRQVRRLLGIKKVGHAGTLDPFASGLLIICAGRPATRLIGRFMDGKKIYSAILQLGMETETMDPEGKIISTCDVPHLTRAEIEGCLREFTGRVMQVPPPYSAVKYKGKPLYHYARRGESVVKEPREVEIFSLTAGGYDVENHRLEINVTCSRGTYIRVLASDIGKMLGCGAYLLSLRRLASGAFHVQDSLEGVKLTEPEGFEKLMKFMISVDEAQVMLDKQQNEVS